MVYLMRNGTYSYLCVYTGDAEWETEKWEGTPSGEQEESSIQKKEEEQKHFIIYVSVCIYTYTQTIWANNAFHKTHRLSNKKPSTRHEKTPF